MRRHRHHDSVVMPSETETVTVAAAGVAIPIEPANPIVTSVQHAGFWFPFGMSKSLCQDMIHVKRTYAINFRYIYQ
jgi:hypothetical protein